MSHFSNGAIDIMNRMSDRELFQRTERHLEAARLAEEGYHCYDTEPLTPIDSAPIAVRVALEPQAADEPITFKEQTLCHTESASSTPAT
jgi:hypothetical protein